MSPLLSGGHTQRVVAKGAADCMSVCVCVFVRHDAAFGHSHTHTYIDIVKHGVARNLGFGNDAIIKAGHQNTQLRAEGGIEVAGVRIAAAAAGVT